MTLFFLARRRPRADYRVFVHAYPEDPERLPPARRPHGFFNLDHDPLVPARRWPRGRAYADEVVLSVLPPGRYRIEAGLFDAGSGAVLVSADAGGIELAAGRDGAR